MTVPFGLVFSLSTIPEVFTCRNVRAESGMRDL